MTAFSSRLQLHHLFMPRESELHHLRRPRNDISRAVTIDYRSPAISSLVRGQTTSRIPAMEQLPEEVSRLEVLASFDYRNIANSSHVRNVQDHYHRPPCCWRSARYSRNDHGWRSEVNTALGVDYVTTSMHSTILTQIPYTGQDVYRCEIVGSQRRRKSSAIGIIWISRSPTLLYLLLDNAA